MRISIFQTKGASNAVCLEFASRLGRLLDFVADMLSMLSKRGKYSFECRGFRFGTAARGLHCFEDPAIIAIPLQFLVSTPP